MEPATGSPRELTIGWRAAVADEQLRRSYADADFDDEGWAPITVPGHWRSAPAFADSDGPLLYRCRFDTPPPVDGRRTWLTFDGLFYLGDVWLDGAYLGDTEGYFIPHTFEVTNAGLDRSEHALAVEVTCPPQPGPATGVARRNLTGVLQGSEGGYLDPTWNPGGIWRAVRLTETGPVRIAGLRVLCTEASADRAVLAFRAVLDSDGPRRVRLRTEVGALDHEGDQSLAAGSNEVNWTVTVDRPALWWPRALGEPVLHDVRVAVVIAEAGVLSDERRLRTGLRSVRLRRWIASVNGERLFLKGSNLGPTRQALGEASAAEMRRDVELAVDAGLDLLRVHAHVARPELYDAADAAGMLLWQDMPLKGPYARGIRRQAVRQAAALVDLLGHHPAIFLWCGHDEPVPVDWGEPASPPRPRTVAVAARLAADQQLPTWNRTVLDAAIKRAFNRADGCRPVVAHSGVAPHLPQLDGTDSHLPLGWLVGDERDLPAFAQRFPRLVRFVSRFGAPAVPAGDGAAFAEPARWPALDWARLEQRHALDRRVLDQRVPPEGYATFGGWRDATQRYQANLVRRVAEELRRLKYRPTGGFAQFLFADGHPGVTPAVLDHERRPKAGYDALRAACRPVIVVADRLPATVAGGDALALDVHVVSDRRAPIPDARVTATLSWPDGRHTWRWSGDVDADACVRVGTIQAVVPELGPDAAGTLALDLELILPGGDRVINRYESRYA
jgi:beta-mannosidase